MSTRTRSTQSQRVARLRNLLAHDLVTVMPCCYDGLSAKLIERAGFEVTFMTGFGVSAVHGLPDTQVYLYTQATHFLAHTLIPSATPNPLLTLYPAICSSCLLAK